jgi:hypothetical protein
MSHPGSSSRAESSRAARAKRNSRVAVSDSEDETPVLESGRKKRRVIAETQEAQGDDVEDDDPDLNELGSDAEQTLDKGKGRANGNGHLEDGDEEDDEGDENMNGDEETDGHEGALAFRPEYDRDPKDKYVGLIQLALSRSPS